MTRIPGCTIVCLLLAGCASAPRSADHYSKAGTSHQDQTRDRYACAKESERHQTRGQFYEGTGAMRSETVVSRRMFLACMNARGYTITTRDLADGERPGFPFIVMGD